LLLLYLPPRLRAGTVPRLNLCHRGVAREPRAVRTWPTFARLSAKFHQQADQNHHLDRNKAQGVAFV